MLALAEYPLRIDRVDLVGADTNIIYRVRDERGRLFALRLVPSREWRTEANLRAEVAWLGALKQDSGITVPEVVATRSGDSFAQVRDALSGRQRRALLVTWLPGMLLTKRLTAVNVEKLGELFGRLHAHARGWNLPSDFPELTFDSFLGRGDPNELFDGETRERVPAASRDVLTAARERVAKAYAAVTERCVIHCDLWHENVKLYRGELAPIDFEDTIIAAPAHDLAMGLLDLAETVRTGRYETLSERFRGGYERIAPFPAGDLLGFQMGRVLWQLNWIARFQPQYFDSALTPRVELLETALARDRLVYP